MSNKSKGKRYKCPYCDHRAYRSNLIDHVDKIHEDLIPKNYTASRVVYNSINKKDHGTCMICHKETEWDENKQRYDTLCGNPKCKKQYVEIVRARMVHKYGTYNLLKDPNFQKKMLANRSISGKYKFKDGGSIGYVGSYEKKFLEFMDNFLHIKSYDIISPGPNIPYMYKGEEHVWITDFLYEPYNLVFDIKDGGDNPNTRDMKEYREKQIAKEKAIAEYGDYNYIRLTDNKFEQLILLIMELKEKEDNKPIIRINEYTDQSHIISSKEDTNMIIESSNEIPEFESDKELSEYMKKNISYKKYTKLMSPEDVYHSKKGSCHDQVMFELYCLQKLKLHPKALFLIEYNDTGRGNSNVTHSLVYYKKNNKIYWFENAWGGQEGIHEFNSLDELKEKITDLHNSGKFGNACIYPDLEFRSFKTHKPGETLQELVNKCLSIKESYANESSRFKRIDMDFSDLTEDMLLSAAESAAHYTKWCRMDDGKFCNVYEFKKFKTNLNNATFCFATYRGSEDTLNYILNFCNENNSFKYGNYKIFPVFDNDTIYLYGKIKELFQYIDTSDIPVNEETRIDDDKIPENIYHISTVNHNGEVFEPRYYDNDNVKKDMERRVKRVCFSDSINGAFYSIFPNGAYDIDLFVHVPGHKVKVYETTEYDIYDSDITHEVWVKEPVEMKCIGKIHVSGVSKKYHTLEIDKDKSGYGKKKYYEPIWNWVERYENSSIKENSSDNYSVVYFTKEISPKSLQKIYHEMNHELQGKIAVKISTGELGGHNFLSPKLIKDLVQELNGTIVECNTAYKGKRNTSIDHWETIKKHGFLDIAKVDIMDEDSDFMIPITNGYHLNENYVGSNMKNYDSVLMLSHFKGHTMAGYGGALKNMSIGMASSKGKINIHTAGKGGDMLKADRNKFLESMVDADQSIINYFGKDNILYINVANNLSIDCDCDSNPKDPEISDIGIFASTDPVAIDQACIDAVYNHPNPKKRSLINRIESRNGTHTIECAYNHNLGNKNYLIIDIDKN